MDLTYEVTLHQLPLTVWYYRSKRCLTLMVSASTKNFYVTFSTRLRRLFWFLCLIFIPISTYYLFKHIYLYQD